jgi:type II secretory pathway pseudopilin PulG
MFKSKNKGLAIVETILVIAISAALFVVVIGVFNTRQRTQYDDAARQVMSEIAKVRNEAQQGEGPSSQAERDLQSDKELYGKAIKFNTDAATGLAKTMTVENLVVATSGAISSISSDEFKLLEGMNWYINSGNSTANYCSDNLTSCYKSGENYVNLGSNIKTTDGNLVLVFLNRSGAGYALSENTYKSKSNYTASQQLDMRLAFAVIGQDGITAQDKMNNAIAQYYANINLLIPNSQSLEVVK